MPTQKRRYRSYVQLFIPTRDKDGKKLSTATVKDWQQQAESLFQQHVGGYYVSPVYCIAGAFHSAGGEWIKDLTTFSRRMRQQPIAAISYGP